MAIHLNLTTARLWSCVVCRRANFLLNLFVFAHSGVQHILCCVCFLFYFILFFCLVCLHLLSCIRNVVSFSELSIHDCSFVFCLVYVTLSVSLNCTFMIAPSFSLTFISFHLWPYNHMTIKYIDQLDNGSWHIFDVVA